MGIITRMMKQKAVYWAPNGTDKFGQQAYAAPVELRCRWEDKQELFIDITGTQQVSKSIVYVESDVKLDGVLWLGELEDVAPINPFSNEGASKIRAFGKLPKINLRETLRTAIL